jgi:hypothetical protein
MVQSAQLALPILGRVLAGAHEAGIFGYRHRVRPDLIGAQGDAVLRLLVI